MAHLELSGVLRLGGTLKLSASAGGQVQVNGVPVLVEAARGAGPHHGMAPPVIIPPPPAAPPTDPGTQVWIFKSFNATVTAGGKNIVTQGMCAQGNPGTATWPGMVQPSMLNQTVTINGIQANVVGDMGTILPTGAPVPFDAHGQG
jgi:hypothetical protein